MERSRRGHCAEILWEPARDPAETGEVRSPASRTLAGHGSWWGSESNRNVLIVKTAVRRVPKRPYHHPCHHSAALPAARSVLIVPPVLLIRTARCPAGAVRSTTADPTDLSSSGSARVMPPTH